MEPYPRARPIGEAGAGGGESRNTVGRRCTGRTRARRSHGGRSCARAHGLDGARIEEFQALNRQASLFESYKANLDQVRNKLESGERSFERQLIERRNLVEEQARFLRPRDRDYPRRFGTRISPRRVNHGNRKPLARFLKDLGQRGITRWWNEVGDQLRPAAGELLDHLRHGTLNELGMSDAVQATFGNNSSGRDNAIGCHSLFRQLPVGAQNGGRKPSAVGRSLRGATSESSALPAAGDERRTSPGHRPT